MSESWVSIFIPCSIIFKAALDSSNPYEMTVKSRLLVVTSTGSIQLWDGDSLKWTREEGLSSIAAAQFVEIPERVGSEGNLDYDREGFLTRLLRHISSAQVSSSLLSLIVFK